MHQLVNSDGSQIKDNCFGDTFVMKRIFVGNLPWKATEELLKTLFEAHGEVVSVRIVTDPITGKSRGFAFVEMADADAAKKAIEALDNTPFLERPLRVSLAHDRPRGERPSRGEGRGDGRGDGRSSHRSSPFARHS
jgi:RNA recognition motif-containing protein